MASPFPSDITERSTFFRDNFFPAAIRFRPERASDDRQNRFTIGGQRGEGSRFDRLDLLPMFSMIGGMKETRLCSRIDLLRPIDRNRNCADRERALYRLPAVPAVLPPINPIFGDDVEKCLPTGHSTNREIHQADILSHPVLSPAADHPFSIRPGRDSLFAIIERPDGSDQQSLMEGLPRRSDSPSK